MTYSQGHGTAASAYMLAPTIVEAVKAYNDFMSTVFMSSYPAS